MAAETAARYDGDSWDVVSSVGYTALGIAVQRALESTRADALIDDPYAELFVRAAGVDGLVPMLDDPMGTQQHPGLALRPIGLRSRFFDDFTTDSAARGCGQVVILAAGLDARAFRLAVPAGATVFELDQPKVLEFKDAVLGEHSVTPRCGRREVAVDLRDDWPAALIAAGFDPKAPTAWIAEGLLPYLPGAAQDLLYERIAALSAPGSALAVEIARDAAAMAQFAAVERKYADPSHPMGKIDVAELFYTDDERRDPNQWLTAQGWTVADVSLLELAARYAVELPELPTDIRDLAAAINYSTASYRL